MEDKKKKLSKEYLSPAKLNLFFRVLSKRADGFHEVATLMQAVDLADRLFFLLSSKDQFTTTDPSLPLDENNLVMKALTLFRNEYRKRIKKDFFVAIHLEKKIPKEAGLGGGSSNAATTLFALNEMLGKPFSQKELMDMAKQIGTDVSFFLLHGIGYGTGRGEKLEPLHHTQSTYYLIKPSFGLSTKKVFSLCSINGVSQLEPLTLLKQLLGEARNQKKKSSFSNDLEKPAFLLEPRLKQIKEELILQGFLDATMTGSGTTFFVKARDNPPKIQGAAVIRVSSIERKGCSWYKVS